MRRTINIPLGLVKPPVDHSSEKQPIEG